MSNLILVFLCLLLGLLFQRIKQFPENAPSSLNAYVVYVALPALVLNEIPKLELDGQALVPVLMAWLVMFFGGGITWLAARWLNWSREVTGAMILVVALGNSGFVGIPLVEAMVGKEGIPYAILYDQFGTFIALNTLGVILASYYSGSAGSARQIWWNIVKFPPFIALIVAFVLRMTYFPVWMSDVLPRISSTLVPVVMIAVGLQWRLRLDAKDLSPLFIGVLFSLVVTPAFAWLVIKALAIETLAAKVAVLEAAMPAMISAGVLAMSHQLAPRLASAMVGYTLMLSLLSVWLWSLVL